MQGLDYIPISPAYPQKESGFILKWWGVELRVLGSIFLGLYKPIRDSFRGKLKKVHKTNVCEPLLIVVEKMGVELTTS